MEVRILVNTNVERCVCGGVGVGGSKDESKAVRKRIVGGGGGGGVSNLVSYAQSTIGYIRTTGNGDGGGGGGGGGR